jgi:RND family efflux transporter MFP subunit
VALRLASVLILFTLAVSSCGRATPPPAAQLEGLEASSVTRWTDRTELFAEYPPLVVGETSRFAIHLTRLDSFKPLTHGTVDVVLRGGGAQDESFRVEGPSRPGIFGVDVKPARAGARELVIRLRSTGLEDEHGVGEVTVHPTPAAARSAASEADGTENVPGISFLKEQQWTLDFATALVTEAAVRQTISVPARIQPRPGGAADVAAPIDGRLSRVTELAPGAAVSRGQELARLLPPTAAPGDLPQLQRAVAEATTALALATRDRERAERLTSAGAAPARRLDEARAAEEQARARLVAADATLAQYNAGRTGGAADGGAVFAVRAPIAGVIAERDAAAGANVAAGAVLFRIVDTAQPYVVGDVPEAAALRARDTTAAEVEVPGRPGRVAAGRLISLGQVIDPQRRTLPITFALDNRTLGIPIGQAVSLHLLMNEAPARPVVPAAAVVDDAGRPIIFVQREGETFERRAVTTGLRSGDVIQILDGLKPGERVVTRGAYLVRLASLSTSVPAHGHVH